MKRVSMIVPVVTMLLAGCGGGGSSEPEVEYKNLNNRIVSQPAGEFGVGPQT